MKVPSMGLKYNCAGTYIGKTRGQPMTGRGKRGGKSAPRLRRQTMEQGKKIVL